MSFLSISAAKAARERGEQPISATNPTTKPGMPAVAPAAPTAPLTPAATMYRPAVPAAPVTPTAPAAPPYRPAVTTTPTPATAFTPTPTASPMATPMATSRPVLPDALFPRFANLIYDISGMKFEPNKSYFLASKIDNRVQALGMKTFEAYLAYIESPSGRAESAFLIDEVSINETFFYRHEPQLAAFVQEVLMPLVFARKTQRQMKFRIWSAAASTGDELYTLALMIKEAGMLNQGLTFELVGTDISHEALKKARDGVYKKYNVRNIPPAVLSHNFSVNATQDSWTINADIKAMCRFQENNLMDTARIGTLGKFDVIFCRNVLIYFDEKSKEQVVKNMCSVLQDDGVVLLGHSENVYGQRHILRPDKARTASISHVKAPPGSVKHDV